jgi:hypothetical protein
MDWKKFFIAFVAAFGFIFLFGFLWYGKLMHGAHQEVPHFGEPKPILVITSQRSFLGTL